MEVTESTLDEMRRLQDEFEAAGELGIAYNPSRYFRLMTADESLYVFHIPSGDLKIIEFDEISRLNNVDRNIQVSDGWVEKILGYTPWVECVEIVLEDGTTVEVGVKSAESTILELSKEFEQSDSELADVDALREENE